MSGAMTLGIIILGSLWAGCFWAVYTESRKVTSLSESVYVGILGTLPYTLFVVACYALTN